MAKMRFDEALRAVSEAYERDVQELKDQLAEALARAEAAEREASEKDEEAANASAELNDARDDVKQLLEDKENLLRLLGLSEHEYDCEASRLRFADPAKFLHERLVAVAGL